MELTAIDSPIATLTPASPPKLALMPADASAGRSPWLFDEERGTFEAPAPEQLTIVVDGNDDDGAAQSHDLNSGPAVASDAVASEAAAVSDQSWFGAIRMAWMQPTRNWWWR
jgi:hypothetical protein